AEVGRGRAQATRLGRAGCLRHRAQDRRLRDLARLRERRLRPRRHARGRLPGRGRDPQSEDDQVDPARAARSRRRGYAACAGGAGRLESIEEVAQACREWERRRIELDYEIDGIVIKVDSFDQQLRLGSLHERPRWARAFKWAPLTATTRLNKILIRVGRTGALNPWAMLEPVEVGGVTVSRATLHN